VFQSVAVVGATGAVGSDHVSGLLEERGLKAGSWTFLSSKRSAGTKLTFQGAEYTVQELTKDSFRGHDLVIGSTPDGKRRATSFPAAVDAGCIVIDESGYFRDESPMVALVIPEINPQEALKVSQPPDRGIISSPNCSTTQMVIALKPLHDAARVNA